MPRVEETIYIDRPVEDVFAYATDPDNQTTIQSNLSEFESDGPIEKGARTSGLTRVAGRTVEWSAEVSEYHRNDRVEFRSLVAPMDFHVTWTYTPEGQGCRVTFEQEVGSLGSFFGRLADPIVTKLYARDVRGNLEKLKVLLES
jgi:uncharacterized membrane protein